MSVPLRDVASARPFFRRIYAAALIVLLGSTPSMRAADAPVAPASGPATQAKQALPQASSDVLPQLMALLARRSHGEADFQEVKYLAVLKQPLKSSGVLIYDAPDHLEQRIEHPRAQTVSLDHGVLTLRAGKRVRSIPLAEAAQIAPLVESMRALLAGDRGALEQLFTLRLGGSLASWQLQLEPRDARLSTILSRIDIHGESDAIREVQLYQSNGDHSIMLIQPRS